MTEVDGSGSSAARKSGKPNVAICGAGAVTGYGWGRKFLWDGLGIGESAVVAVGGNAPYVPGDMAYVARVADQGDPEDGPSRFSRALRFAAREAITDAMDRGWRPGPVVGVVHSLVLGDVEMWGDFHRSQAGETNRRRWVQLMPSTTMSLLMKEEGFHGPCMAVSAMCASGNAGLLTAKSWIDAGLATDVVLIATDISATPENLRGFSDLGVMVLDSPALEACRPFQEGSRGFMGGEASIAMVVSSRSDGAYATIRGGSMTHDAYHAITIAPDNVQVQRCFTEAMANAGVDPGEVGYLNAHGPGTALCDAAEARALDELLPQAHGIFSIKPLSGHCQGAASAVEVLASCYSFETGFIPAPPQVAAGHPRLLDGLTPRQPGLVLKSSIGMGGYNSVVVLEEPNH